MNAILSSPETFAQTAQPLRWGLQASDQPHEAEWGLWTSEDPFLREGLIKAANCGILGLQTKFETVAQLEKGLAPAQLAMLGLTTTFARLFQEERPVESYSRHFLWRHCVATAHVAETIARVTEACNPLDAFAAGLCHDIGWIEIESTQEMRWQNWLVLAKENAMAPEQEASYFPLSHADAGYEFLEHLDAPHWVSAAARYHHRSHLCDLETQPLVGCVAVSNYLVSRQGWSSIGMNNTQSPASNVLRQLGVTSLTLRLLWSQLSMLLDEAGTLANSLLSEK
ncbi:MAG: HDOD domain-containing protein [Planctomycetaceae bacterium]|nr:HDOD domain-containing protein [Planctomycetaceae bacterium]